MSVTTEQPEEKKRISVSFSEKAHEIGKASARRENRNFSNYLETLIFRDAQASENEPPRSAQSDG